MASSNAKQAYIAIPITHAQNQTSTLIIVLSKERLDPQYNWLDATITILSTAYSS